VLKQSTNEFEMLCFSQECNYGQLLWLIIILLTITKMKNAS